MCIRDRRNSKMVGKRYEVLVDGSSQRGTKTLAGRTTQNKIINFPGSQELLGKLVEVQVTNFLPNSLQGELVEC